MPEPGHRDPPLGEPTYCSFYDDRASLGAREVRDASEAKDSRSTHVSNCEEELDGQDCPATTERKIVYVSKSYRYGAADRLSDRQW